jgi:hypothetical protein
MDEFGACKICDGEIPHGHSANCYLWKLEQKMQKATDFLKSISKERDPNAYGSNEKTNNAMRAEKLLQELT